ncbi:ornithine carbamoyltransferase [Actinophytocola xinjiangensis]|uniref:Ornithine carbamoyltransferase n=1 Tax=Actinophytocola xinjiangensis TaxID=485602 RepID=A0A7Z0WPS8_9PSEU|nr:ornithine carbamoyltransferase [Actinophytocola xinjiangensis]OLF11709.1 ornithine carbamoyltransferase [Actinophytocola xinjiangensis]
MHSPSGSAQGLTSESDLSGPRHLLSATDLGVHDLDSLVRRSVDHSNGVPHPQPLRGKVIGIYFRKTSTRTRTAFSVGALKLGAEIITFGPDDLQERTGESPADTGRVLSSMLDGFVARTAGDPDELRAIAANGRMAVVNAMTRDEHPTQGVTDLSTMLAVFGRLDGLRVLYLGEGNNTAAALAYTLPRYPGTRLSLRTPSGYGLPPDALATAHRRAAPSADIEQHHHLDDLPDDVDVIYTSRWQTTGTHKADRDWRREFVPFRVDQALMARYPAAVFMHDLPAHRGEEVDADVLDGPRSVAFQQAEHKLYGAMSILEWCAGGAR